MADIQLIHGDCMEYMATLKDKAFELAIVDPPYGIGDWTTDTACYPQKNGSVIRIKKENTKKVKWNEKIPDKTYFSELCRISQKQIIWGANYYNCFDNMGGAVVWYKGKINPVFSQCEIGSLSFQKRVDYVNIDWQAGFARRKEGITIHPCQKPVALYQWLLKNYAKPGDRILDTHLGSGSSAIAADIMGFDFVGIEIDESYFLAAKERLERHQKQTTMFDGDIYHAKSDQLQCGKDDKDIEDYQNDLQF